MISAYQPRHNFTVGTWLRQATQWTYAAALADSVAHAAVVGVVSRVISTERFEIATPGEVVALPGNLLDGTVYYLSDTAAGAMTSTAPAISVPVLVAISFAGGCVLDPAIAATSAIAGALVKRDATTGRAKIADAVSGTDIVNYQTLATYVIAAVAAYVSLSAFTAKGDLVVGSASGAAAAFGVGADGLVLTADSTKPLGLNWTAGGGGGGGGTACDLLSALVNAEVAVTGAVTLGSGAFAKMHKCSGTSANYAVTLPAVSGNGGKFIGLRGDTATGLTKVVAITPASGEIINGRAANATLALLWDEQLILYCDGAVWHVISHVHATWQSFTPSVTGVTSNPTKATSRTETCYWKRVGNAMHIAYMYNQPNNTGGAAGSGTYKHGVPGGFAIDTTYAKSGDDTTLALTPSQVGYGNLSSPANAITNAPVSVGIFDANNLVVIGPNTASVLANLPHASNYFSYALAGGWQLTFAALIPISGW